MTSRFGAEGGFPSDQHRQQPGTARDGPDPSARQARPDLHDNRQQRNEGNEQNDNHRSQQRPQGVEDPTTRASRPELRPERNPQEQPTWATPRSDLGKWGKVEYERPAQHRAAPVKPSTESAGGGGPMQGGYSWQANQSFQRKERAETAKQNADVKKHANDKPRRF